MKQAVALLLCLIFLLLCACEKTYSYVDIEEAREAGYADGRESGYEEGKQDGYHEGYNEGYRDAKNEFEDQEPHYTILDDDPEDFENQPEEAAPDVTDTVADPAMDSSVRYVNRRIEYDESGNLISDTKYSLDSSGDVFEASRVQYSYDINGNLSSERYFTDGIEDPARKTSYVYDDESRLLYRMCNDTRMENHIYDDSGNCIEEWYRDEDGVSNYTHKYKNNILVSTYAEIPVLIELSTDSGYAEVPVYNNYTTEYDSSGRVIKEIEAEYGETPYTTYYTYSSTKTTVVCCNFSDEPIWQEVTTFDSLSRPIVLVHEYFDSYIEKIEFDYLNHTVRFSYSDDNAEYVCYRAATFDDNGYILSEKAYDDAGDVRYSYEYEYLTDVNGNLVGIIENSDGSITEYIAPEQTYYENGEVKEVLFYNKSDGSEIYTFLKPKTISDYTFDYYWW